MKAFLLSLVLIGVLSTPVILFASHTTGLVPCHGTDCRACDFVQLGQNIITWLITVMTFIIALVFVVGGFQMVTSGGSSEAVSSARNKMTNAIIGLFIILLAWLIIDTVLKLLLKNNGSLLGQPWHTVACVDNPDYAWVPNLDRSRGVSASSPTASTLPTAVAAVGSYKDQLCVMAQQNGIGNECASLQAIMTQESGGDKNARSRAGAIGLMQIMPSAARSLDSNLAGLTDAQITEKLLNPTYNMQIGVAYYKKAVERFGASDYRSIYASYNGGFGATRPSSNCAGVQRWECGWDDDAHTIENIGYRETRDYVEKVARYRETYTTGQ